MNIAAYCRVSTDKSDQLNSLETQKKFFTEFTKKNGHNLVKLYADEGISGTKVKNRKEFQQLMRDAKQGMFEMVVVKDISRFARNTVDFLQSIRTLKELDIETVFLTSNQKVLGSSEFVLTIFAALAQEESANTSKRVKFGKQMNAKKGRVPNLVFGYDKIPGDYFNMTVNEREAETVRLIYSMYLNEGCGASKIAAALNERNIKTKRGNKWTQNAVCRILTNPVYTGKIINGKEEVKDFLTGERISKERSEWITADRPELRIISDDDFESAENLLKSRHDAFHITHERQSNRYLYSTIIRCAECGYSFRRSVYRGQARWVCSGRNANGTGSCSNKTIIREDDLTHDLHIYFSGLLSDRKSFVDSIVSRFSAMYKEKNISSESYSELAKKCKKLENTSQKYMDMYVDELITREKLNEKVGAVNREIEQLRNEMKLLEINMTKSDRLEEIINETLKSMEDITDMSGMTNAQLKRIVDKILVSADGGIDVYLRITEDLGLDNDFPVCYDRT
ncbi:MAG: recombinase family protein [Ruminococcus sp.]|nr:recombinase family protein [Ruminococcus sp.]